MKTFIFALAAAGLVLAVSPSTSQAGSAKFRGHVDQPLFGRRGPRVRGFTQRRRASRLGRINRRAQVRGFTQRDIDRLPISVTRPGNTGHYQYQNFPLWAARAFQPHNTR